VAQRSPWVAQSAGGGADGPTVDGSERNGETQPEDDGVVRGDCELGDDDVAGHEPASSDVHVVPAGELVGGYAVLAAGPKAE
jgi:hypothetical protein